MVMVWVEILKIIIIGDVYIFLFLLVLWYVVCLYNKDLLVLSFVIW